MCFFTIPISKTRRMLSFETRKKKKNTVIDFIRLRTQLLTRFSFKRTKYSVSKTGLIINVSLDCSFSIFHKTYVLAFEIYFVF